MVVVFLSILNIKELLLTPEWSVAYVYKYTVGVVIVYSDPE